MQLAKILPFSRKSKNGWMLRSGAVGATVIADPAKTEAGNSTVIVAGIYRVTRAAEAARVSSFTKLI